MNGDAPEGVDIVNGSQCSVCGQPAVIHDMEYDEYFCAEHGESYGISEGPHEAVLQEAPYVTASGRVLTDEDIEALAEEAEEGYDVPPEDPRPWTITIEVTIDSRGAMEAQREGMKMLEHIVSGWDGAAGAVMNVEPNWDVEGEARA